MGNLVNRNLFGWDKRPLQNLDYSLFFYEALVSFGLVIIVFLMRVRRWRGGGGVSSSCLVRLILIKHVFFVLLSVEVEV